MKSNSHVGLAVVLMLVLALTRWPGIWPEDWQNFSAVYAVAFCSGVYLSGPLGWVLPLATLLVTDVVLNVFYYHVAPVHPYLLLNYLLFAGLIFFGRRFSPRTGIGWLVTGGLLGACMFYLVSNTFAWLYNPMYPKTFAGWLQALTSGIPNYPPTWAFFRNTLLSGGLFTGLFAAAMKVSEAAEPEEEEEAEPEEAPEGSTPVPEESKA